MSAFQFGTMAENSSIPLLDWGTLVPTASLSPLDRRSRNDDTLTGDDDTLTGGDDTLAGGDDTLAGGDDTLAGGD
ncbi:MAG: hypothetical protein ACP5D7_18020, partial [Limnospira sp.]